MSIFELWPQLKTLITANGSGQSMYWKVLYASRGQPLLVPLDAVQARAAVRFFIRNRLLRYWGYLLLTLDHWFPWAKLLPGIHLQDFPCHLLFGSNDLNSVSLFCGMAGPLQKLAVHSTDADGSLGKVAKIALEFSANEAISHEAYWLEKLSHSALIAKFLPRLLAQGALPCGRNYFSMMSLPLGSSPKAFGKLEFEFLGALAKQDYEIIRWENSQAHIRLHHRSMSLLLIIDKPLHELLLQILIEIEDRIGQSELPNCVIHGDFAPWNLRQANGQLFVFDWEYAQIGGNPLQDFLHFHLIQLALKRAPLRPAMMSALLAQTKTYAQQQFGNSVADSSAALMLHYMLDTMTFYINASGAMDYQHPVLRNYFNMLQQRDAWLPKAHADSRQPPAVTQSSEAFDALSTLNITEQLASKPDLGSTKHG